MTNKQIRQLLTFASAATVLFIGGIVSTIKRRSDSEENVSEEISEDTIDYTPNPPRKKSYHGYVPKGCEACGGPYPLCRDGCSAFDD